ncbi:MAG: hypothetical protein P8Z81_05625, partial [Deinococcales bacterium]
VPRVRTREREQLATWLADAGYLDERTVLDPVALELRVREAMVGGDPAPGSSPLPASDNADGGPTAEAERLTTWLEAAIHAGGELPNRK